VNPAEEVGRLTRKAGVLYLLDACQSAGQWPLDVSAIGCDMLSVTGRKFLRGPGGTGFSMSAADDRKAGAAAAGPPRRSLGGAGPLRHPPDGAALRKLGILRRGHIGLGAAVEYALAWGIESIRSRVAGLADRLRSSLASIPGVKVRDLGREKCGIVSFTAEAGSPPPCVTGSERENQRERHVAFIDAHRHGGQRSRFHGPRLGPLLQHRGGNRAAGLLRSRACQNRLKPTPIAAPGRIPRLRSVCAMPCCRIRPGRALPPPARWSRSRSGKPSVPQNFPALAVLSAEDAREKTRRLLDLGADLVKICLEPGSGNLATLSLEEVRAIVETAHERRVPVTAHLSRTRHLELALDVGVGGDEDIVVDSMSDELVGRMVRQGMFLVPTLAALRKSATVAQEKPDVKLMKEETAQKVADLKAAGASQEEIDKFVVESKKKIEQINGGNGGIVVIDEKVLRDKLDLKVAQMKAAGASDDEIKQFVLEAK